MATRARNSFLIAGILMILTGIGSLIVAPEHFIGPIYSLFGCVFIVGAVLAHFDSGWFYQDLEYLPSGRVLQRETKFQICGCFWGPASIVIGIVFGIQALSIGLAGLPALVLPVIAGVIGLIGGFIETRS